MALPIPVPKVISDVGPGGPLVTAMGGINNLKNALLDTGIKGVQAQYAPLIVPAKALSELTYSNIAGPQFLAKVWDQIAPGLTEEQKTADINKLHATGIMPTGVNALASLPQQMQDLLQQKQTPLLEQFVSGVRNAFGFSKPNAQSKNAFQQQSVAPQADNLNAISSMQPGQSYVIGGNQSPVQSAQNNIQPSTFAEKKGKYEGQIEEGKELGKIRAEDMKDLNTTAFNTRTTLTTLNDLNTILASPEIEKIRQTPILGHHELSYYARYGTPEQQRIVGNYYTDMGSIIKDSARDFPGAFRTGEQQLLNSMKPSPSDTVEAARGKSEALTYFTTMLSKRSELTSELMNKYHFNKLEAQKIADQQIDPKSIKQEIHNKLNPKPTDEDINFMAEKYKITPDEVRKRLKSKGVL